MSVVLISAELRQGLQAAFGAMFNVELQAACEAVRIAPFRFNWERDAKLPKTCFLGNRSFEEMRDFEGADFPAVAWWPGPGQDLNIDKPRRFSGVVFATWRYFLAVRGRSSAGLVEQREAVEAAMAATLRLNLDHGSYRKDLNWGDPADLQWVDQSSNAHVGWVQEVQFNASFEVHV